MTRSIFDVEPQSKEHVVPNDYRGRNEMSLQEFIADVESTHFRTASDTGANHNAMFIWNIVRQYAGLDRLTEDDLLMKYHVAELGMTLGEARQDLQNMKSLRRGQM